MSARDSFAELFREMLREELIASEERTAERIAKLLALSPMSQAKASVSSHLTTVNAAKLLNLSVKTLEAWRAKGKGPAYVRQGTAIRYARTELERWITENTKGAAK